MINDLKKIISKLSGSVVTIGLEEELINNLEKNDNIEDLDIIEVEKNKKGIIDKKNRKERIKKNKKINIKKLKKYYKNKKVNYMIVNYEKMKKYFRYFVKNSVYINNKNLYIYGITMDDVEKIITKYKRYNVLLKPSIKKDYFIIDIDNRNSKNNIFKDTGFFIYDTFELINDLIGDFLIN